MNKMEEVLHCNLGKICWLEFLIILVTQLSYDLNPILLYCAVVKTGGRGGGG